MTQLRWSVLLILFLFPVATDLLFFKVSAIWLVGCTGIALIWDVLEKWEFVDIGMCLLPGVLLWILSRVSNGIGIGDVFSAFFIGSICGVRIGLEILFGGSILCFLGQIICIVIQAAKQIRQRKRRKIGVAEAWIETRSIRSEMPFVPWLLASIFINWILQVVPV